MPEQPEEQLLNLIDCDISSETVGPLDVTNKIDINKKKINILQVNIRSVRKNFDELLSFLETFRFHFCDVLVLSECYQLDSYAEFSIQGYTTHYSHGDINKNDGVLMLIKNHLNADISFHKLNNTKITVSKIMFDYDNITYSISCIYRSPHTLVDLFIDDLNEYLSHAKRDIEIITGDININLLDNSDPKVINYYSALALHGFKAYVNSVTREVSGTCLDHFFIKNNLKKKPKNGLLCNKL